MPEDAEDHHRHRSRPGRRRRHPAGAGQPGAGGAGHHRGCRQRAADADREERAQDLRAGRQARHQGLRRRHPPAGARSWSPPRRCMARPASTARDLPEPKMPLQKQHAVDFIVETLMSRAERHGHAVRARAADQRRAGADPRAEDRAAHQGNRADGRRLLRRRQRHADRRVQHLCRSACGRRRVQVRHSDRHDAARRHPQGADHGQAHRRLPQRSAPGSASRPPRCWNSSSASTRRNTAPTAGRCTTPASSPIC